MILYNTVQILLVVTVKGILHTAEDIALRTHITQSTPCVFSILCVSFLMPCSVHKLCYADCAECIVLCKLTVCKLCLTHNLCSLNGTKTLRPPPPFSENSKLFSLKITAKI